jgi:choline kinase
LLRIYGASSGSLISRPRELRTLHVLSSQYKIGPRVFGTFENGRVEEFFDSSALTADELRDLTISRWIGMRMAELHCVDIDAVEQTEHLIEDEGKTWDVAARKNTRSWLIPAREVLELPSVPEHIRSALNLDLFESEWTRYMHWLDAFEKRTGKSKLVFCHNDAQYGNLLRFTNPKKGLPEHRQVRGLIFSRFLCLQRYCPISDHCRRL